MQNTSNHLPFRLKDPRDAKRTLKTAKFFNFSFIIHLELPNLGHPCSFALVYRYFFDVFLL